MPSASIENENNDMNPVIQHTQRGFGLVESLVALVVISVGMIGIAALYGQGLRASTTALARTRAVNLASDMADRIRANRRGEAGYNTANAFDRGCNPGGGIDCSPAWMAVPPPGRMRRIAWITAEAS